MRVYLVQHGDALPKEEDPDRPLSTTGRTEIEHLTALLQRSGVSAERGYHSGKTRARETAEILAEGMLLGSAPEARDGLGAKDPPEPIARELDEAEQDLLIVSHLPFLGHLASRLLTGRSEPVIVSYRPGTMACLERGQDGWSLQWMLRPELLAVSGVGPIEL